MVLESLSNEPLDIIEASDFTQVLNLVRGGGDFDVALLDLSMPGMDGFSAIGAVRRSAPDVYLVVVSASEEPQTVRKALDSGAHGYICKSAGSASMMAGIRSVLEGDTFVSPHIVVPDSPVPAAGDINGEQLHSLLTPRQRDVLAMLRQGKSNKEIARSLDTTANTIKFHLKNIFVKLAVDKRTLAISAARRMNLLP